MSALGPAEIALEKWAKELRSGSKSHPRRYQRNHAAALADNAAHNCRMLARQIECAQAAAGVATNEHNL
jgi:hypothetical protein